MADRNRQFTSPERSSRKRSFAELNTRRPGNAHYLPLHLDASPTFPQAPSESLNRNFPPPSRLRRYEGDGLDLRRPVMSQQRSSFHLEDSPENVIDLTSDSDTPQIQTRNDRRIDSHGRLQRTRTFVPARTPEVIDISGEETEGASEQTLHHSPEVQFLSARPRLDLPEQHHHPTPPGLDEETPHSFLHSPFLRREWGFGEAGAFGTIHNYTQAILGGSRANDNDNQDNVYDFFNGLARVIRPSIPGVMDFTRVPFELTGSTTTRADVRTLVPEHEAPPPPSEGFTRAPTGDDTCICPNCEKELGVGDEIQKQIFVVRQCGHVYCGSCIQGKKGKKRLLSKCVCEGCTSTIKTGKAWLFMLYV